MDLNHIWTTKRNASHAIQKRDTGKRGTTAFREAGKEIEAKETQTSDTHFFLLIRNRESRENLSKINAILKSISYEYVYEGTTKKALRQYLTKKNLDDVFKDIEAYKDKTKTIQIKQPKKTRQEKYKEDTQLNNKVIQKMKKLYKKKMTETLLTLLLNRYDAVKELKERKKEAEKQIAEFKQKIDKIEVDFRSYERTENDKKIELEKILFPVLKYMLNEFKDVDENDTEKMDLFTQHYLPIITDIAVKERQRQEGNERQRKYRDRKKNTGTK